MYRSRIVRTLIVAGAGVTIAASTALFAPGAASAGNGKCIQQEGATACMVFENEPAPEPPPATLCLGSLCLPVALGSS
ncbi:hypothetical protein JGU71_03710 [Antrihabitans sp. YC3-6]|uniref:Uncharacterized protein n=1 Tax=Antrihabitans stalagmiti TaxID=2799499 RepID=A0A934NMN2_9NOCA|nr:hypothetical protein [Antrihabitans stalagmiti]MBJ8337985.1 hypothetical protein [Antrihabitans stalagmiti]